MRNNASSKLAAVLFRIAAIAVTLAAFAGPVAAQEAAPQRALAVELRVALGDLRRLSLPDLPAAQAEGLEQRLRGSLGLLPFLLLQAGAAEEAAALAAQAEGLESRAALDRTLARLVAAYPLDLAVGADLPQPGAALAEAAAIHETYCAGCHDGAGAGDPDLALPARDLRAMAREEPGDVFLARLALGIKGDESIAFRSPVTDRQLRALKAYYESTEPGDGF